MKHLVLYGDLHFPKESIMVDMLFMGDLHFSKDSIMAHVYAHSDEVLSMYLISWIAIRYPEFIFCLLIKP